MRTPIVLALIIILAPYGSSTEGTKIIDHSGDSILEDLSPVVQSAFNRAMSDDSDFEAHRGAWILLSNSDFEVLAQTLPAGQLIELDWIKGAYLWSPNQKTSQLKALEPLKESSLVEVFIPDSVERQTPRFVPNDPDYPDQWHLDNSGQSGGTIGEDVNITSAWNNLNGSGVTISIVDDGLDHNHPDISPNYVPSLSYDFCSSDTDPQPVGNDAHGTAAGGVAGAVGNNGIDVVGAGFGANLAGSRLIACSSPDSLEAQALSFMSQSIDIYSNSWGPSDDGATLSGPGPLTLAAMEDGVYNGRGGLGNIYTWAAGNGLQSDDDSNADGYTNSRFTIAVTAVDHNGEQSYYAEPGANILVSAPSNGAGVGITTTDIVGSPGYTNGDTTSNFGGTSSATPLVSGVISLILEANPNLTWRDVQEVLVQSSRKNDFNDPSWMLNQGGHWFSHKYGFGVIDAGSATDLAINWTMLAPETNLTYGPSSSPIAIPDTDDWVVSDFTVTDHLNVETIDIIVDITHPNRGDLEIEIVSPHGTVSTLRSPNGDNGEDIQDWSFGSVAHWGESSNGTWSLRIRDAASGGAGVLNTWSLILHGIDTQSDHDGDGLLTVDEVGTYGTDPYVWDTDSDSLSDSSELENGTDPLSSDTDLDGLLDGIEILIHSTDPLSPDTDGDGLLDGQEIMIYLSDPLSPDQDFDGDFYYEFDDCDDTNALINPGRPEVLNGLDDDCDINVDEGFNFTDRDFDGLKDWNEFHVHQTDYLNSDTDGDGLSDGDEILIFSTDPLVVDLDSDQDGRYWFEDCNDDDPLISPDGAEFLDGIDNDCDNDVDEDFVNTDLDLDGVFDFEEFNIYLTNPVNPDSDGDGLSDGHEISNSLTDPLSFDSDSDSDGFYWFEDCDDSDPNSSPISPELLDKKDNDCDGFEDEDYIDMDRDGDGLSDYDEVHIHDTMPLDGDTDGDMLSDGDEINEFGSDPRKFDQDSDGDGFYWFEDCDDDDSLTKPSGIETWDGKDQDCDGSIDEGIDRLSELNHTVALLPWEASNVTFRLEPPDFPDGVVTVSQWRVNGATVNKTQEGGLELDVLDCGNANPSTTVLQLCDSSSSSYIQLVFVDSGVETVLEWQVEVRVWSPPTTILEDFLALFGEVSLPALGAVLLIFVSMASSAVLFTKRRSAILNEAILSYGVPEKGGGIQDSVNRSVPAAPDFNNHK